MRAYMHEFDGQMNTWLTPAIKWLMYLCVGTFLLQIFFGRIIPLEYWLAASPATTLARFRLWQLVTYTFLHGGVGHLFVNLLSLWFFGMRLEDRWGTERFVKFVVFTAAGSVLLHLLIATVSTSIGQPGTRWHRGPRPRRGRRRSRCVGLRELLDDLGDLVRGQLVGDRHVRLRAVGQVGLSRCGDGARADDRGVAEIAGCETRPPCMSCMTMVPPSACTASATRRQPAICSSVTMPGWPG